MSASCPSELKPVFAFVSGKPLTEIPADLFIPPDALEVLLDSFTGPLDLLLYLIRRQNIDILDIPIAHITEQYMQYIHFLEGNPSSPFSPGVGRRELAADYLVMAAMLVEIKSRLLLPPAPGQVDDDEEDPRRTLVRKLQLYEVFKEAAASLDALPRCSRDNFRISRPCEDIKKIIHLPDVMISSLLESMQDVIKRQGHQVHHHITKEPLSVRERMMRVLERLQEKKSIVLTQLLAYDEGRLGLIVTLLAILELARESMIVVTQASTYGPIHLQANQNG